jgi:hypothetical protein
MTVTEAVAQIEELEKRRQHSAPISQEEVACPETQAAVRILAAAYERAQKRDPLYGDRRRGRCLPLPSASVPPG